MATPEVGLRGGGLADFRKGVSPYSVGRLILIEGLFLSGFNGVQFFFYVLGYAEHENHKTTIKKTCNWWK